jgi:hypothetical protein
VVVVVVVVVVEVVAVVEVEDKVEDAKVGVALTEEDAAEADVEVRVVLLGKVTAVAAEAAVDALLAVFCCWAVVAKDKVVLGESRFEVGVIVVVTSKKVYQTSD